MPEHELLSYAITKQCGLKMAKKPLGPNSPPPPRRGENKSGHDLTILKNELEHEKRLRQTILWSNSELERIVNELEDEIREFDETDPNLAEPWNEWWVRLEAQKNINEQLEQQRKWLELELEHSKQRTAAGSLPEAMNFDLDSLSETELIRLVKRLERQRTDLYSTLRNLEFRLDKEGREQHRLSEMKNMYQAEVHHYTRTLDRLKHSQRTMTTHTTPTRVKAMEPKLPPLDVVQPPMASRWGNSSQSKRNFNPHKGPVRRAAAIRNLPKIQEKRISSPRGKVDKRNRRIKSGNKEQKKEEIALVKAPIEIPAKIASPAPVADILNLDEPDFQETTTSLIMKTITELAQRPLEIVDTDFNKTEAEELIENLNLELEENNLVEDEVEQVEEVEESPKEIEEQAAAEEISEKTEEITVTDEIECN